MLKKQELGQIMPGVYIISASVKKLLAILAIHTKQEKVTTYVTRNNLLITVFVWPCLLEIILKKEEKNNVVPRHVHVFYGLSG